MTTLTSYGTLPPHRQGEIIRGLASDSSNRGSGALAKFAQFMRDNPEVGAALSSGTPGSMRDGNPV